MRGKDKDLTTIFIGCVKKERINMMDEPLDKNKLGKGSPGPWDNDKLKLIDEKTGELLLECRVGDKYHQLLLETGLNTILEKVLFEYESGGDFLEYVENRPMQEWENK